MDSRVYNPLTVENERKEPLFNDPKFWKRLNRVMYALAIVFVFILGMCLPYAIMDFNTRSHCYKPTCVKIGAEFLSTMNQGANPCDNFYEFSCGNIFKYSSIAPEMINKKNSDRQYTQILEVLSEPIAMDDPLFVKNSKFMFSSCMKLMNEHDIDSIMTDLGGWPIVARHQWQESAFNWTEFDIHCHKMGIVNAAFINFDFTRDEKSNLILKLNAPNIPRKDTSEDNWGAAKTLAESFKVLNAQTERELNEASELGQKLRDASCPLCQVTIQHLMEKYPQIHWVKYINQILPDNVNVDVNQTITIDMNYLDNFFQTINTVPKRVQANYAISKVIVDIKEKIEAIFMKSQLPLWKQCIQRTYPVFRNAIHYMYRRKFLQFDSEKKISKIIDNVKDELLFNYIETKWPECRNQAYDVYTQLLPKMKPSLQNLLIKAANDPFSNVSMDEGKFLRNMLKIEKVAQDRFISLDKIFETYTLESAKKIEMAPMVFQDPLYVDDGFDYMNYGSFGGFVGSLIMKELESCSPIQNQKANHDLLVAVKYKLQTEKMNKTAKINRHWQTVITNGSHIGLEAAYFAYMNAQSFEQRIIGLNYPIEQMFWISSARALCTDKFSYLIDEGIHVPFEFQFNNIFSSIPSFVKDFNCPIKSNMNPKKMGQESP